MTTLITAAKETTNAVADYRSFMFETIGNRNKNVETSFLFFIACLYNKMFY